MNEQFQIISDGSCDLPPELTAEKQIRVIPFYVSFDGTNYRKELEEIGIREFYQEMVNRKGVYPRSSLPSVQDYMDAFLPYAKAGIPMLVVYFHQTERFHAVGALCQRADSGRLSGRENPRD